jgi:hypothetical protein
MDISRFLAELIKEKSELVVPGLGTFYKEQIPANFDGKSQSFLPPTERIAFINEAGEDDTLVQCICQSQNISPASAKKLIEEYISNLHDQLLNTELIKIDLLGSFEKSENGFAFEADPGLLTNPYFGLRPQAERIQTTPITENETVSLAEPEGQIEFEGEEIEVASGSRGKSWLLALAVLLTVIAAIQVFYPQAFDLLKLKQPEAEQALAPLAQADTIPAIDTSSLDTNSNKTTDTSAVVSVPVLPDVPTYEIVIAAFGKRSEAESFIQQLSQRGITARALPNRKKEYIKISVGSFNDEQQAQAELQRIQRELSKGAWIYKVKPLKQPINVSSTN